MKNNESYLGISPSLLNEFVIVQLGLYNKTTEDLINYITRKFEVNDAISRGWAYHKLLEDGPDNYKYVDEETIEYLVYEKQLDKTWTFHPEAVQPVFELRKAYENMVHETWCDYNIEVNGRRVKVRMRLDGLYDQCVNEFKTTGRKKNRGDYETSFQWRANLVALPDLKAVNYTVFVLNKHNSKCQVQKFTYDRYETIQQDVDNKIIELVNWLEGYPELIEHLTREKDKNPLKGI